MKSKMKLLLMLVTLGSMLIGAQNTHAGFYQDIDNPSFETCYTTASYWDGYPFCTNTPADAYAGSYYLNDRDTDEWIEQPVNVDSDEVLSGYIYYKGGSSGEVIRLTLEYSTGGSETTDDCNAAGDWTQCKIDTGFDSGKTIDNFRVDILADNIDLDYAQLWYMT